MSQPSDVTVAMPGDKFLRKTYAPNFRETLAKVVLRAPAFRFSKQPLAASPAGSASQRPSQRGDPENSTSFLSRLRPTRPSLTSEPQLGPAAAPSRQSPGPLSPRSQTGAAFSSAPGRSPPQLTGCYYSL